MEIEELLPLSYIFTIEAAFQGVSMYLMLVWLTKSIRDELLKWTVNKYEKVFKPISSMVTNAAINLIENFFFLMLFYRSKQEHCNIISNAF